MLELPDSDDVDLDFTRAPISHAVAPQQAPAPQSAVEAGADALDASGYHVMIARRAPPHRMPFGKPAVLVIDDDTRLRTVLEHYLGKNGYATRLAGNRQQILAALQTSPLPDLILLDVAMPGADGFDLLEKFQQSKVVGDIPVVVLTARCGRDDIVRALTLGAAGYITKPAKLTLIGETLRVLLGELPCEIAA